MNGTININNAFEEDVVTFRTFLQFGEIGFKDLSHYLSLIIIITHNLSLSMKTNYFSDRSHFEKKGSEHFRFTCTTTATPHVLKETRKKLDFALS